MQNLMLVFLVRENALLWMAGRQQGCVVCEQKKGVVCVGYREEYNNTQCVNVRQS
jgi:hypothetical protein